MEFFPLREFQKCVARYRGHYVVQRFSCHDQFRCMAFAPLTYRESLRDIEACLRAMQPKLYHMGFRGGGLAPERVVTVDVHPRIRVLGNALGVVRSGMITIYAQKLD